MHKVEQISDSSSDEELLQLYRKSRKPEYLVGLYGRYTPLVYGVALKYLKSAPDAREVVMLILEDLFEKILQYDIRVFKSWLYTCVRNYCLVELRSRSKNLTVELDEKFMEFCDGFTLDREDEPVEQDEALQVCLESLPERQRKCVHYFFFEEFSYKEIEQKSGFSLKMIKSFIQNGKRNLRVCLEQKGFR